MTKALPKFEKICPGCGGTFRVNHSQIERGRGRACSRACAARANRTLHGHAGKQWSPTYGTWANMLQRCLNPNATKYPQYGGRGITVCDDWRSFDRFLADMGERPDGKTLDRIDGAKGYSPDNCRWATPAEQMDNVCNVTWVDFQGERITLSELVRRTGVRKETLKYRIAKGWSDEALASPPSYVSRSR